MIRFWKKKSESKRDAADGKIQLGVIAVITNEHGEILMGRRSNSQSGAGLWEFPGGKVELGESTVDALHREVMEETGCGVEIDKLCELNEYMTRDRGRHFVGAVYLCHLLAGTPQPERGSNGHDWFWFDRDKLPSPLFYHTLDLSRFGARLAVARVA